MQMSQNHWLANLYGTGRDRNATIELDQLCKSDSVEVGSFDYKACFKCSMSVTMQMSQNHWLANLYGTGRDRNATIELDQKDN